MKFLLISWCVAHSRPEINFRANSKSPLKWTGRLVFSPLKWTSAISLRIDSQAG
ncbi:hypothetical protein [Floridanema aerugineum]|uniref:Uncharacterized protein n=1 Tax=Floridaenema aerugineum BLCC-F46 TaxID=3153654 RepID=A0ABV4WZ98_9CYAN